MVEIKVIPQTACLLMKVNGELVGHKFYNKFEFEEIEKEQIENDAKQMINEYLKTHIEKMLSFYRWHDRFESEDLDIILELADYTDVETSNLINKFHYINTRIADNGGVPVLKQILQTL
jgi:hypothetical protein